MRYFHMWCINVWVADKKAAKNKIVIQNKWKSTRLQSIIFFFLILTSNVFVLFCFGNHCLSEHTLRWNILELCFFVCSWIQSWRIYNIDFQLNVKYVYFRFKWIVNVLGLRKPWSVATNKVNISTFFDKYWIYSSKIISTKRLLCHCIHNKNEILRAVQTRMKTWNKAEEKKFSWDKIICISYIQMNLRDRERQRTEQNKKRSRERAENSKLVNI